MTESDAAKRGQVNQSAAEIYETFFVPALFGQWPTRVLEAAGLEPYDEVLDVGCGTGVLARAAFRRLAGTGSVTGLDLNTNMLALAETMPEAVVWHEGSAENLPFGDNTYDRVVSQFALMFFTDQRRALEEMVRVARPGGTVTVATWARIEESPGYAAMADIVRRVCGDDAGEALLAPFTLGTEDALKEVLDPVVPGWTITREDGVARFDSVEAWIHTDIRGWTLSDMIDDAHFDKLVQAAGPELAAFTDASGRVSFPAPALVASVTVPD